MDEALSVVCPTCSGRIRIKDAALIGQIIPCPRCQGLVLVHQDQEQIHLGVDDPADSQIETRDAISSIALPTPPLQRGALHPAPPPIEPSWEVPDTQRKRQLLMVGTLGLLGLVAASLVFGWFVYATMNKTSVKVAEQDQPEDQPGKVNASLDPPEGQVLQPTEPEPAMETPPSETDSSETDPKPAPDSLPASSEQPVDETPAPMPMVAPPAAVPAEERVLAGPNSAPAVPRELVDPTQPGEQPVAPAEPKTELMDLPPELRQFIPFLDTQAPQLEANVAVAPPPTAEELRIRLDLPPPSSEFLHPPPAEITPVGTRLDKKLVGYQSKGVSLAQVAITLSQLSGVPIWFDQAKLDAGGIDLTTPREVRVVGKSIRETLDTILSSVGCEVIESPPGFLCVQPPDARIRSQLLPALMIEDLGPADPFISALIQQLASPLVFSGEPDAIPSNPTIDAATGSLLFEPNAPVGQMWLVAICLDGLRQARGLPGKLPAIATQRWLFAGVPPEPEVLSDAPVGDLGDFALSIPSWLDRLAQSQQAGAIIQWPAAWQHGLTVAQEALPYGKGATLAELSQQLLKPYDLRAYRDAPNLWWVGPEQAYRDRVAVVTFPLTSDLFEQSAALLTAISRQLSLDPEEVPAIVDSSSKTLILRMPRGAATSVVKGLQQNLKQP